MAAVTLDDAWQSVEAVLPNHWRLSLMPPDDGTGWLAVAVSPAFADGETDDEQADGFGLTPADALLTLRTTLVALAEAEAVDRDAGLG